ncbi:MAG TPA: hypothetical protein VH591_11260 [Ktedonobacterales bacterium]|jgi:hypothetical protein
MSRQPAMPGGTMPLLLAVTLWAHRKLLLLHPPAFRRDYGVSITQVFRQTCLDAYRTTGAPGVIRLWMPACGDVLLGALAEYSLLILGTLKGSPLMVQYRRSASIIFAAFIAFVIAGIGFQKSGEYVMQTSLPNAYPLLAISYNAMMVGAVVALLAVLVGGVPIAFAALRYAVAHRRGDILARFAVPIVALLVIFAGLFIVVSYNIGGNTAATIHTPARFAAIGGLAALFILAAVASTYAVLDAIARAEIPEGLLRFALLPGVVATIAMAVMVLAHLLWSFALWQNAPDIFWGDDGLLATSTLVGMIVQVVVMVVATIVAIRALTQGFAARNATTHLA